MLSLSVQQIITHYQLLPHPEGGYYKETYRSSETIAQNALPERFTGVNHFSTAIYFLLEKDNFSAFHKIKSDECWHFYSGQTLLIYIIDTKGILTTVRLGNNIPMGDTFQYVVPAECWFAAEPAPGSNFSLVGCTVAPGFDFNDFELAKADILMKMYPQFEAYIRKFCRK